MPALPSAFSARLIAWQKNHGRHDLPWQCSRDPYRVWLSEVMLQQTQVATVIPYYRRFLERFPDVAALAAASPAAVAEAWAGLGYYSRGRNLHRCARQVVADHGGRFPASAAALEALPGIGRSTAAAIAAFAWGERAAILDGNVKRVLCRHFGVEGWPEAAAVKKTLWALAESLLPAADCGAYTQGLMDLGATLCTRRRPDCSACPLAATCIARQEGRQGELPAGRQRTAPVEKAASFLLLTDGRGVLVERRPPAGIWGGLLVPPEGEPEALLADLGLAGHPWQALAPVRHSFTHFRLLATPVLCRLASVPSAAARPGREWLPLERVGTAALPALFRRLLVGLGDVGEAL